MIHLYNLSNKLDIMDIGLLQLDLINKPKKYQNLNKKLKVDITRDANNYITSFGTVPGYVILKSFKEKKLLFVEKIITFLKNFFSISRASGYRLYNFQNIGKFKTLIISWTTVNDFRNDGTYRDSYFRTNSKNYKDILWVLISSDGILPKKIGKNITILFQKNVRQINILYLLKIFFLKIITSKFSIRTLISSLSFY